MFKEVIIKNYDTNQRYGGVVVAAAAGVVVVVVVAPAGVVSVVLVVVVIVVYDFLIGGQDTFFKFIYTSEISHGYVL